MIKEWSELNKIVTRTSNYAIAKEHNLSWIFIALLLFYLVVSGVAIWMVASGKLLIPALLIGLAIWLMQLILDTAFLRQYDAQMKGVGRKKKLRYFRYLKFKEAFDNSQILDVYQITHLLRWQAIENQKAEGSNFFETKIFINPATGLLGLILAYFGTKGSSLEEIGVLVIMAIGVLFIAWSVFDIFTMGVKRQVEMKRSLEWLQLEQEVQGLRHQKQNMPDL